MTLTHDSRSFILSERDCLMVFQRERERERESARARERERDERRDTNKEREMEWSFYVYAVFTDVVQSVLCSSCCVNVCL